MRVGTARPIASQTSKHYIVCEVAAVRLAAMRCVAMCQWSVVNYLKDNIDVIRDLRDIPLS